MNVVVPLGATVLDVPAVVHLYVLPPLVQYWPSATACDAIHAEPTVKSARANAPEVRPRAKMAFPVATGVNDAAENEAVATMFGVVNTGAPKAVAE